MTTSLLLVSCFLVLSAATVLGGEPKKAKKDNAPPVYYVLMHSHGPKWIDSLSFQQQPGVMDHVNYMASFLKSGKLVEGGPFLDDTGGMMVFNGSKEEAMKVANEDPTVKSGLLKVVVRPWLVAMSSK